MKRLTKILVPTDLSDQSRRGLRYACSLTADEQAALVVLHVANEFKAWELFPMISAFSRPRHGFGLRTVCSLGPVSISIDSWNLIWTY